MADQPQYATLEDYEAAQRKEWGTYVATQAIDILGGRAFNPGDPVPVSHVDSGIVSRDSVVGVNTKTAEAVKNPKE
jgi:hypothetical protein